MPSMSSKVVAAALGTLGSLALLASVGHRLERGGYLPSGLSRATTASHNTRLLRTQGESRETTTMEFESRPQVVSGVLQKTVVSSTVRMVFVVGLEGTGHHFMNAVLKKMCTLENFSCPNMAHLAKALYFEMGTPKTPSDYRAGLEGLRSAAKALALHSSGLEEGRISLLIPGGDWGGEMSFPTLGGNDKPLQYVDFRILAEEAERAGIDFRMIYLVRSARNLLLSDTQNRHFGKGFAHEARILINSAAVVDSYFREVHPDFTTCFSYETISDPAQASRVASFFMPTEEGATKLSQTLLESAVVKPPAVREDVDDEEGWDLMSNRLQGKLDMIERSWC